jgi:hypothetical protein
VDLFERLAAQHLTKNEDVKQEIKLESLDTVEIPAGSLQETKALVEPYPQPRDEPNVLAGRIKDGADRGADKLLELLKLAVDRGSYESEEGWLAALRVLSGAVQTALNTQLRVDEGVMQQQRFDRLPELLKIIKDEEKRLPMKLVEAVIH